MQSNQKAIHVIACGMIWLWLLLILPESAFPQDERVTPPTLLVGVMVAPPLYMKTADGQWGGFGIEVWQAVARQTGALFEYREYNSFGLLLDAIKNGDIDVIPSVPVEERYESTMDFSQSYLKSGLAIAVPAEGVGDRWMSVIASIFSKDILGAVGLLVLMSLAAGIIVWSFERRRNSEMFGDGALRGIGHGLWWSMVTMTTVGYGDKAPKTIGGRIVALIWMIFSIVFIASFTANITASLTIGELRGKVRGFNDLHNARVGSISRSEGFDFLAKQGIAVIPIENYQEGLLAVDSKKIDAFVQDEYILHHLVKSEFPGRVQVLPGTFDEYFVSIALQEKGPLRKPINNALLKFMRTQNWTELLNRYIKKGG